VGRAFILKDEQGVLWRVSFMGEKKKKRRTRLDQEREIEQREGLNEVSESGQVGAGPERTVAATTDSRWAAQAIRNAVLGLDLDGREDRGREDEVDGRMRVERPTGLGLSLVLASRASKKHKSETKQ
jgi:hypothetical protein